MRLLFVDDGDRGHAAVAAALWERELARRGVLTTASSCGIHARPGQHAGYAMAWAAAQQGIDLSTHGSRPLDAELLAQADLVLTLTRAQADHVGMTFGSIGDRLFLVAELAALLHGDHSAVPAATAGETFPDPDASSTARPSAEGGATPASPTDSARLAALLRRAHTRRLVRGLCDDDVHGDTEDAARACVERLAIELAALADHLTDHLTG